MDLDRGSSGRVVLVTAKSSPIRIEWRGNDVAVGGRGRERAGRCDGGRE